MEYKRYYSTTYTGFLDSLCSFR